jgi:uncharacterized membrane protein YgcG
MRLLRVVLLVFGWTVSWDAQAADPNLWTVANVSGEAQILGAGNDNWTDLQPGGVLDPGSQVQTGAHGRISLIRPGDSLSVSPNSRFEVPPAASSGSVGHIRQTLGTLLFKIKTRPDNPFEVRTPYLTGLIKGTTFSVVVDGAGASLHVSEGAVLVTSAFDETNVLVRPGQTGIVAPNKGRNVRLSGGRNDANPNDVNQKAKDPSDENVGRPKTVDNPGIGTNQFVISEPLGFEPVNFFEVTGGLVNSADVGERRQNGQDDGRLESQDISSKNARSMGQLKNHKGGNGKGNGGGGNGGNGGGGGGNGNGNGNGGNGNGNGNGGNGNGNGGNGNGNGGGG